jgi:hypothetical protein
MIDLNEMMVPLTKKQYDAMLRVVKHATDLERCIARSPGDQNHPKFLLKKALEALKELKP